MSHEIYKDYAVSVRVPMWHGIGHVPSEYLGRDEMIKLAGHNFQVLPRPIYAALGKDPTSVEPVKGWKALVHSEDNHVLSVVKDTYEIIQNDVLWDILDLIVNDPDIKYETAGTLREGAILWAMARLNRPIEVKGDHSQTWPFITVWTSHDLTTSLRAIANYIRTVCMNTLTMADKRAREEGLCYTFRHTKNVKEKIEFARQALGMVKEGVNRYSELVESLAERQMTFQSINEFLTEEFLPMPPQSVITDKVKTNILVARQEWLALFNGETVPEAHQRTAYGVWAACVEYLDHYKAYRSKDTYFKRSIMDAGTTKMVLAEKLMEAST